MTEECDKAFINIKEKWKIKLRLLISNLDKKYEIETDSSDTELGAVLIQNSKV